MYKVPYNFIFFPIALISYGRWGVIFFTNQHFITDWFVHTGVITYKWICRWFFFSTKIMFRASHEIEEVTKLCSLRSSSFRVGRNFGKPLLNFTNFWQNVTFCISRNRKTCTLRNYVILLISCFASNKFWMMKKKLSTDSFVNDDPRVYEPVCYEILVGKEYYAMYVICKCLILYS